MRTPPRRQAEWREDLKALYRLAGVAGKRAAFLLDETQIKYESFLEDVNNILTSGEVPTLFAKVRRLVAAGRARGPAVGRAPAAATVLCNACSFQLPALRRQPAQRMHRCDAGSNFGS